MCDNVFLMFSFLLLSLSSLGIKYVTLLQNQKHPICIYLLLTFPLISSLFLQLRKANHPKFWCTTDDLPDPICSIKLYGSYNHYVHCVALGWSIISTFCKTPIQTTNAQSTKKFSESHFGLENGTNIVNKCLSIQHHCKSKWLSNNLYGLMRG